MFFGRGRTARAWELADRTSGSRLAVCMPASYSLAVVLERESVAILPRVSPHRIRHLLSQGILPCLLLLGLHPLRPA
jgi:hypothetical protein